MQNAELKYQALPVEYSIMDPTGNITALVETPVEIGRQPYVAAEIMRLHPAVEQVGFVQFGVADAVDVTEKAAETAADIAVDLRMAGGEFCGNAVMCAAALYLIRRGQAGQAEEDSEDDTETVMVRASGAADPLEVRLRKDFKLEYVEDPEGNSSLESVDIEGSYSAGVRMPEALEIYEGEFCCGELRGELPVVRLEGISHVIIEPDSELYGLMEDKAAAEEAVRAWCNQLSADGLGLVFLEGGNDPEFPFIYKMTPLVFIPGSGTVFWENSCASGSAAAGRYLASRPDAPVMHVLNEPGGRMRVFCDPRRGMTWLYGSVRMIESFA